MAEAPTQLAATTTVSNLVVTPQTTAVSVTFTTNNAVRAQLQIGTAAGPYPNKFTVESVAGTSHSLSGYGLTAGTLYHYILQFYDAFGATLDASSDATFTTAAAPVGGASPGAIIGQLSGGNGVPAASMGNNGDFYFRYDGSGTTNIYHKASGAWVAIC